MNNIFLHLQCMNLGIEILVLLKKELVLEWRQKYAISGILLYVLSTVFIVFVSAREFDPSTWNSFFWIIILFASVNAITKSFVQEGGNRQLYYYSLVSPLAVIISKIIYNVGLLLLISILTFFTFGLFSGSPVQDLMQFWLAIFLGSLGFSITFTFISAIASKSNNSATLMAILGFPVVIPILLMLIKLSSSALGLESTGNIDNDILILIGIDFLLVGMSIILFPFLWRD